MILSKNVAFENGVPCFVSDHRFLWSINKFGRNSKWTVITNESESETSISVKSEIHIDFLTLKRWIN